MKHIALFLSLCFSLNVMAASGTVEALESAFDNYQYAMTVEWDQKDQKFADAQTKSLLAELEALEKQGLTKESIEALAQQKIQNKEALAALKLKLSLLVGPNTKDLSQVIQSSAKDFYTRGASWNGSIDWGATALITGITALVAYVIYFYATHECTYWYETGSVSCSGYDDGYRWNSTCSNDVACASWVKK